jgi:hypothetical protein
MITNKGKSIIGKFLLGQTSTFASHIAVGCGATPLSANSFSVTNKALSSGTVTLTTSVSHNFSVGEYISVSGIGSGFDGVFVTIAATTGTTVKYVIADTTTTVSSTAVTPNGKVSKNYSTKTSLDFEMFRVPIVSRGYIYEDGMDKVVLTAELPTEERYEITEIAAYSGGTNPVVLNDSKQVFSFSSNENWELHNSTTSTALTTVVQRLDLTNELTGNMAAQPQAFFTTAENEFFNLTTRLTRQERPRYLNNTAMIVGDVSGAITTGAYGSKWTYVTSPTSSTHIHLTNILTDFDKNSSDDELRLAFSVINKDTTFTAPTTVSILIEFADSHDSDIKAQFQYTGTVDPNNRYIVAKQKLGDMYKGEGFTWNAVNVAKIYVSVDNSSNYYVALDGFRLENTYSGNPLYGMSAYSAVKNIFTDSSYAQYAKPIIKNPNTSNYVELRFSLDVI